MRPAIVDFLVRELTTKLEKKDSFVQFIVINWLFSKNQIEVKGHLGHVKGLHLSMKDCKEIALTPQRNSTFSANPNRMNNFNEIIISFSQAISKSTPPPVRSLPTILVIATLTIPQIIKSELETYRGINKSHQTDSPATEVSSSHHKHIS